MVYTTRKNKKIELRAYTDVDWVGNIDDRKSTSGGDFFLGKRLITWTSKKQNYTSQSTVELNMLLLLSIVQALYGSNNYSKV